MWILIKYIYNSIKARKARSVLIILSIVLSVALYFASNALSMTMEGLYEMRLKQWYGAADLIIHAGPQSPFHFFHFNKEKFADKRIDFAVGLISSEGYVIQKQQKVYFEIRATTLADMRRIEPVKFVNSPEPADFSGHKMIIPQHVAEKLNLKAGDSVNFETNNCLYKVEISGIVHSRGYFTDDGQTNKALVPLDFLGSIYQLKGRVNVIFVGVQDKKDVTPVMYSLYNQYKKYVIRESVSPAALKDQKEKIILPFRIMLLLVFLTCIFIIYTTFQVLTRERLPVIGSFRSIGATKKSTTFVFFLESFIYGVVGSALGCILGVFLLRLMTPLVLSDWYTQTGVQIYFSFSHLIISFFVGVVLSLISSAIPIIRIVKIPIKNIILNIKQNYNSDILIHTVSGILIMLISIILPFLIAEKFLFIYILCFVGFLAGACLVVPFIIECFVKLFQNIYYYVFSNLGILAIKNLKRNKSAANNVTLLMISLASLFIVNTLSRSIPHTVTSIYNDFKFEIEFSASKLDRTLETRLKMVEGVEDTFGMITTSNIYLPQYNQEIKSIRNINLKYPEFWNLDPGEVSDELIKKMDTGRYILLASGLKKQLMLEIGDVVELTFAGGVRKYEVSGFFHSNWEMGSFALIADRYLKLDARKKYLSRICIKSSKDPEEMVPLLQYKFLRRQPQINTINDAIESTNKSWEGFILMLRGFSFVVFLIGIIGVINNLIINFMEREQSIAIYRSIGMSKKQNLYMLFIEALSFGSLGSIIGILCGVFLLSMIPGLIRAIEYPALFIRYTWMDVLTYFFFGIAATILIFLAPASRTARIDVINVLKKE